MTTFDATVRRRAPMGPVNLDPSVVVALLPDGPLVCSRAAYIDLFCSASASAALGETPTLAGVADGAAGSTVHDARAARRPGPLSP